MATVQLDTVDLQNVEFQQYLSDNGIEAIVVGQMNGNDVVQYSADRKKLEIMIEQHFDPSSDDEVQYLKSFIVE